MKTLIEKGPYRLLKKDPTDRLSRKLTEKLLDDNKAENVFKPVLIKSPSYMPFVLAVTLDSAKLL